MVREDDSRSSATPVPHGAIQASDVDDTFDAESLDAIAVGMVSPNVVSWNHLDAWLLHVDRLRRAL